MKYKQAELKSSQPYFVLESTDFRQSVYLQQGISHFYSFRLEDAKEFANVPDGCVDLLFEYTEHEMRAFACGTVMEYGKLHWEGEREIFGVRFLPGYPPAGLSTVPKELINRRLLLDDILSDRTLIDRMAEETAFESRMRVFLEEYTKLENREDKPFGKAEVCMAVKDLIYESYGTIRIQELSEKTKYTERYINKVFIEYMGYSPKVFCKIIQFQRALEMLNYREPENMTLLAQELGYYDQPQFIRDFKKYAGITPNRYLKMIREKNFRERIQVV